jgi:cation transport ATPase
VHFTGGPTWLSWALFAACYVTGGTSGVLEALATRRTADAVRSMLDLAPQRATRLTASGEETVDTARLTVDDVILVRPGRR